MPNINDARNTNNHLTTMVEGIVPAGMIARQVVDVVYVPQKSGKYFKWDSNDAGRVPHTLRAAGSDPNVGDYDLTTAGTYTCTKRTWAEAITEDLMDNAEVPMIRESLAKRTKTTVELELEARVATALTTQASYATTNRVQLAGTDQWNNASFSGSIEERFDTASEAIRLQNLGAAENFKKWAIIPSQVAKVMKRDAGIRELIKYTQSNLLVDGDLPPTIWGWNIIIPKVGYVSTQKGASTQTKANVWGNHVVLGFSSGSDMIDAPSFVKLFVHKNYKQPEGYVRSWVDESKDYTEFVEYVTYNDVKITSNVGGYLIEDCIA